MGLKKLKEKYKIEHLVQRTDKGICIGSSLYHDIIILNADGTFAKMYKNRKYNDGWNTNQDLVRYQEEMIPDSESGLLEQIINSPDDYCSLLPVFTIHDGELIETFCEQYGYPNLTVDGELMYENTFFQNKDEAIKYGIDECNGWIKMLEERKIELQDEVQHKENKIQYFKNRLSELS